MSVRTAVAGTATVVAVVGVLGSPAVVDGVHELAARHASPITAATFTGFPSWDVFDDGTPGEAIWGIVLKLAVLLAAAAVLATLAGRASRRSAFLAGWASLIVAAGVAGAVHYAYQYAVVLDGQNALPASYLDNLLSSANAGAAFGLWTGWIVGAAVAATVRVRPARRSVAVATGPIARAPGGEPITPPAPWWAADAAPWSPVRYDPASVFPVPVDPAAASSGPADPTLVAGAPAEGPPPQPGHPEGVAVDSDLDTTLATPLARRTHEPGATRPIPVPPESASSGGAGEATDPAAPADDHGPDDAATGTTTSVDRDAGGEATDHGPGGDTTERHTPTDADTSAVGRRGDTTEHPTPTDADTSAVGGADQAVADPTVVEST
jgi:hypothetical protein